MITEEKSSGGWLHGFVFSFLSIFTFNMLGKIFIQDCRWNPDWQETRILPLAAHSWRQ
ncbi:hypothetical protein [uncultured Cardiobacterium sp.]|uniref:hypothetical protein n=1 Tax=uncultured Cardiobacterium sp. TaxID=417619 RepID=UPI0026366E50|nr:hypothetical protein [uncultured Cardiobacterium sp.]